ncbi:MAG: hypothetical protein ACTSXJ_01805 [Candidatus Baldrarchaeia archaeon]
MPWKDVILEAYTEARPYIVNVKWFKELLNKILNEAKNLNDVIKTVQNLLESEDVVKQTDLKIFLMFLEKVMKGQR